MITDKNMAENASKIKYPPVFIAGPTATGKSELALKLAKLRDGVIISADSMQIYKGLDIGTAKVSADVREEFPHKLIDIVEADGEFSVAMFKRLATDEIIKAQSEGKLPIVVGGTGLYFEALFNPLSFAHTSKNTAIRDYLEAFLNQNGAEALHDMLEFFDSDSANRINVNDVKRTIRALEIALDSDKNMTQSADKSSNEFNDAILVVLNADRGRLYNRINARVDDMFEKGLVNEALSIGKFDCQSMQAIGYKEFRDLKFSCVNGKLVPDESSLAEVKDKIKQHTRNYAKRQITWFKRYSFAKWFDIDDRNGAIEYILSRLDDTYTPNGDKKV